MTININISGTNGQDPSITIMKNRVPLWVYNNSQTEEELKRMRLVQKQKEAQREEELQRKRQVQQRIQRERQVKERKEREAKKQKLQRNKTIQRTHHKSNDGPEL